MKIFRIMLNQGKFFSHSFSYAWPYCQLFIFLLLFFPQAYSFQLYKITSVVPLVETSLQLWPEP